jgi:hypothetical protein
MTNNESEQIKVTLIGEVDDVNDDNIDVFVHLPNGEEWVATFFTLENIAKLLRGGESTGERLSGKYFWATDMVILKDLKFETIEATAREMVRNGWYLTAFTRSENSAEG